MTRTETHEVIVTLTFACTVEQPAGDGVEKAEDRAIAVMRRLLRAGRRQIKSASIDVRLANARSREAES